MSSCADCPVQRRSPCSRLHKRSLVTSQGTTRLLHGEDQTISVRPPWARPRLLSVEQIIEHIEDLRTLIPAQVTRDG